MTAIEYTDAQAIEQKWDHAIEAARAERTTPYLTDAEQSLNDASVCAYQAVDDGTTVESEWYAFAVGVAANDDRSAHLFTR